MEAAKEQAIGAHRLPELREAEAAAAAAYQRLSIAKAQIEEEAARVERRRVELARRLEQLDADIAREQQMVRDNADVLQRLDTEEAALNDENASSLERETSTRGAFAAASAALTLSEAALAKLTAERAVTTRLASRRSPRATGENRSTS